MTFHVGMKVVCIDVAPNSFGDTCNLSLNQVYTIRAIEGEVKFGAIGIHVAERRSLDGRAFRSTRFRPVTKTSIEIFQKIRKDVEQSVPVKEASNV